MGDDNTTQLPPAQNVPAAPGQVMFSVIMPVYNQARYVEQAVRSVQAQTFANWELLITDDGSTDDSGEVLARLSAEDARIRAQRQDNAGPAAARAAAIARSGAPWIAYLDGDDLWYPHTLATYAAYIAAHPDAQLIYGYRDQLDPAGRTTAGKPEFQDRVTNTADLFGRVFISQLSVCHRRCLYDRTGGYDPRLRLCEDYDLYLRMSLLCPMEPLNVSTGLRRRHQQNISSRTGRTRMYEAEVLRRFYETPGGREVLDAHRAHRRLGKVYGSAGKEYFKARDFAAAQQALGLANTYWRTAWRTILQGLARCLRPLGRAGQPPPRL